LNEVTTPPAISFEGVTKHYRGGGGVTGLTFHVSPGEVFGLLGPNGAGKSTAIRLLVDLIRPVAGTISVFGRDLAHHSVEVRQCLGYLPGDFATNSKATGGEVLSTLGRLKGLRAEAWTPLAASLRADLHRPMGALSKGGRQKIGLISALMGDPPLLVLDEPTTGLDPLVQQRVHREIRRAAEQGRTVLLSSHVLAEVGEMADRIGFIRDGVLAGTQPVDAVQDGQVHLVTFSTTSPVDHEALAALAHLNVVHTTNQSFNLEIRGSLNGLVQLLSTYDLSDFSCREPTLEERFLSFYDDEAP